MHRQFGYHGPASGLLNAIEYWIIEEQKQIIMELIADAEAKTKAIISRLDLLTTNVVWFQFDTDKAVIRQAVSLN